jgi:hypothetical protein
MQIISFSILQLYLIYDPYKPIYKSNHDCQFILFLMVLAFHSVQACTDLLKVSLFEVLA